MDKITLRGLVPYLIEILCFSMLNAIFTFDVTRKFAIRLVGVAARRRAPNAYTPNIADDRPIYRWVAYWWNNANRTINLKGIYIRSQNNRWRWGQIQRNAIFRNSRLTCSMLAKA